jgi:hypothetical protein
MNLRIGPDDPGAFRANELVTCDYVEERLRGATKKFYCSLSTGDIVKVRYGLHNGHVEGSVLATRLLWALGFAADRVYPVRVRCRGCSADPWRHRARTGEVHDFDPAVIERKPQGHEMWQGRRKAGWGWPDLNLVDERQGGAPRAQRDALTLLAVLMQHGDTKSQQQRLLCLPGGLAPTGECTRPFLMLHDVGLTFGHANMFNRMGTGSVNFDRWVRTPVWRDPAACIGHLSQSFTGTLGDPQISEAGRKFLADLLVQLTDRQLLDLFEMARVDRRTLRSSGSEPRRGPEDWVAAFKHKRDEIVTNRCPA